MSDYQKNKLSWWLLILATIVLILMVPLSFLVKELAVPLIITYLLLVISSIASRVKWEWMLE